MFVRILNWLEFSLDKLDFQDYSGIMVDPVISEDSSTTTTEPTVKRVRLPDADRDEMAKHVIHTRKGKPYESRKVLESLARGIDINHKSQRKFVSGGHPGTGKKA